MGKLPTIVDRGTVVTEAAAICAYLADRNPKANLAPAVDDPKRGAYYRWLFFGAGCLEWAVLDKALERTVPAEKSGMIGYGTYDTTINTLAAAVKDSPFLLGEQFTAADVYVGAQIEWGIQFGTVEAHPEFTDYMKRFQLRDGYKKFATARDSMMADLKS